MSPIPKENSKVEPDDIPNKILALMRHFTSTLKIGDKTSSMWAIARLGFDGDFEIMTNHIGYNIRALIYYL